MIKPSYCASACVLVYAGGKTRYGIEGSMLGLHRFVTTSARRDPVADTQRTAGIGLELHDEDGRLFLRRGSHVRNQAISAGSASGKPRR